MAANLWMPEYKAGTGSRTEPQAGHADYTLGI